MPPALPASRPEVGDPRDLLLDLVHGGRVTDNAIVVTSLQDLRRRAALPARHPDRARDRRRPRRGRDLPARPSAPVRRSAPDRHRPGAHAPRHTDPDRRGGRAVRPTPGAFLRVGLLLVLAVVLQISAPARCRFSAATSTSWCWLRGRLLRGLAVGLRGRFRSRTPARPPDRATMGVSSLVLTAVGYGVGRFRELRDPSHGPGWRPARSPRAPGSSRSPPCRSCSTSAPPSARWCCARCW